MSNTVSSTKNKKYGLFVLVTIIVTFLAVLAAIYFTVMPLMSREEEGRISGSINTFTNFYVDNTSIFRNKMLDTLNFYNSYIENPDSLAFLCNKLQSISSSVSAISIAHLESGYFYQTDSLASELFFSQTADSLLNDCINGHHFSTTLTTHSDKPYYISCYPFFNKSDEPFAVAFFAIDMKSVVLSMEKHNPYKEGNLYILYELDRFASIDEDDISILEDPLGWAAQTYGPEARDLILKAYSNPNKEGFITMTKDKCYFAKYENVYYFMFFYAIDRKYVSDDLRLSLRLLLLFCLTGGIVILYTCTKNMKRMSLNARHEEQQRKDLELAASIQRSMLPSGTDIHMSIDIGSKLIPAKGIGGDLFYHWVRDGRLYFCIGDISGKGIPASLYMSKTVSLFHIISKDDDSPSEMAAKLNRELCLNNDSAVFLTLFIGILDLRTHELSYCNAGHDEPIYWDGIQGHEPFYLKTSDNCPLGFEEETAFTDGKIQLSQDYLLVLYTDGINEAKSDTLEMFGFDRLLQSVSATKELCSDSINSRIITDVSSFVGKHEQSDDMTLLTLRHNSIWKTITISNFRRQLRKIGAFLKDIFNEAGFDVKESTKVRIGIDEAMTNVVNYAYEGEGDITLAASICNTALTFCIIDNGVEFNPLNFDMESDDSNDDKIGGLGISIIKQSFDKLEYSREENTNRLTMIKYL